VRTNVVLIDLENVQPESLAALNQDHFRILVFVGRTQARLPVDLVMAMQRLGERAEFVRISGSGPNALDFHIAFYIGEIAAQDPNTYFHIVSKDTGFDPLIQHLKGRRILASRSASVGDIPSVKAIKNGNHKFSEDRARLFIEKVSLPQATKPRSEKTLASAVAAFFHKQLTEEEVRSIVDAMKRTGFIAVNNGRVVYQAG
jgi:hypothetical protein